MSLALSFSRYACVRDGKRRSAGNLIRQISESLSWRGRVLRFGHRGHANGETKHGGSEELRGFAATVFLKAVSMTTRGRRIAQRSIQLPGTKRGGRRRAKQLELVFRTWGGARKGAGRPRGRDGAGAHAVRPAHSRHHPLHVTLRVVGGVASLRSRQVFRAVKRALGLANAEGAHREQFRLVHYSVQGNHIHLLAEAVDGVRVSRGVQGLAIRIARGVNRVLGRKGRLFSERFHARSLRSPREVRNALAYVLLNERRHLAAERGLSLPPWYFDGCSSAAEFGGWRPVLGLEPPPPPKVDVMRPAQTYLLKELWKKHGLIAPDEVPRGT